MKQIFVEYCKLLLVLLWIVLLSGCQQPSPIDLTDREIQLPEVSPPSVPAPNKLFSTADIDSVKYFPDLEGTGLGQLLIEGAEYDSPTEHHEAAIARAIFFNNVHPIIVDGDTAYPTINAGVVHIDSLALIEIQKRYTSGSADTVLGLQYVLYNEDGVGGRGFSFDGIREYHWQSSGSPSIPAFNVAITTPPSIHVTFPDPQTIVRTSNNLTVRWSGGGDEVRVCVRAIENGKPSRVIFQLRIKENRGSVIIPRTVLGLLPLDQPQFMFTFTSSQTSRINLNGFTGEVIVQAVTTHNLVLRVKH